MVCFRGTLAPSPTIRRLRSISTTVLLLLETFLSRLYSFIVLLFFSAYSSPSARAWWDPSKGSALVIYAPHNDAVARYLALRLSSGSPSSFAFREVGPTTSHPKAPYTCFVLHTDPNQFSITVAQWAAKKARIEKALLKKRGGINAYAGTSSGPPSPTNTMASNDVDSKEPSEANFDGLQNANPTGVDGRDSSSLAGDETPRPRRPKPSSSSTAPASSTSGLFSNRFRGSRRKRSKSWSTWIPPDLFGYGMDMLKGWRPGQGGGSKTSSAGTIIPIMADPETQEGLAMVTSTISAYCNSHNLLLSGILLVPSVLCPRNVALTTTTNQQERDDGDAPKTPGSVTSDIDPLMSSTSRDVWGDQIKSSSSSSNNINTATATAATWRGRDASSRLNSPKDPFGLSHPTLGASTSTGGGDRRAPSSDSDPAFPFMSSSQSGQSPPLSPTTIRMKTQIDDEQQALSSAIRTDVMQSQALINALWPALSRDRGRVIGLVPEGHGLELPDDPETIALRSLPPHRSPSPPSTARNTIHNDNDKNKASHTSSMDPAKQVALKPWPSSVVVSIRQTLRAQYAHLSLRTASSSSSTGAGAAAAHGAHRRRQRQAKVHVSIIETPPLVKLPKTRLKKVVKWNERVKVASSSSSSSSSYVSSFPLNQHRRQQQQQHQFPRFSLLWMISKIPLLRRLVKQEEEDGSGGARLSGGGDGSADPRHVDDYIIVPEEIRPFLRLLPRPLLMSPTLLHSSSQYPRRRSQHNIFSITNLQRNLARRLVRCLRWLERCLVPFDDLSEHVAAVSYPIPTETSCPPTPGPHQPILFPYTIASNTPPNPNPNPTLMTHPWSNQQHPTYSQYSYQPSKRVSRNHVYTSSEYLNTAGYGDTSPPKFSFSTASSGPAHRMLHLPSSSFKTQRPHHLDLDSSSSSSSSSSPNIMGGMGGSIRIQRTYPAELSHQNPSTLFEVIRLALNAYHPKPTYFSSLSGWLISWSYWFTPWIHTDVKTYFTRYLINVNQQFLDSLVDPVL